MCNLNPCLSHDREQEGLYYWGGLSLISVSENVATGCMGVGSFQSVAHRPPRGHAGSLKGFISKWQRIICQMDKKSQWGKVFQIQIHFLVILKVGSELLWCDSDAKSFGNVWDKPLTKCGDVSKYIYSCMYLNMFLRNFSVSILYSFKIHLHYWVSILYFATFV